MKTFKNLSSVLVAVLLAVAGLTGCQDYEIPAADTSLSYPAGEMLLSAGSYTSARPSVRAASDCQFSITGITHNDEAADAAIASIDAQTGIVTLTPGNDPQAVGNYLVSVRLTAGGATRDYPDVLKIVVKGIVFAETVVTTARGEELTIPADQTYLVQQEGTEFTLAAPEGQEEEYAHITVDKATGAVSVDAGAEAGIYPISIRVKNRTNPDGTLFANVLTLRVESAPYDLLYAPSTITLIPLEGHVSPKPTVRAADADGTEVTYALADDFGGVFTIDAATGTISLPEDTQLVTTSAKTYALEVKVTNAKGTSSFPGAYTVVVDPAKKAEPITSVTYPDTFPVELRPGQAWTSERPTVTGSTVGIAWSIDNAPQGVTIDAKTGVITFAAGHRMPLLTQDNTLAVKVTNQGMETPYAVTVGDFSIDPIIWQVAFHKNYSATSVTDSGISNMDRYSFSGYIQNNQTEANKNKPTTIQVKNAFGKAVSTTVNKLDCIDFVGVNDSQTWSDNTNQNNDWLVSSEIEIPADSFNPAIAFNLVNQYGTDAQNILGLYIIEIDAQHVYTKGEQNQDDKGMDAMPSGLQWIPLAATPHTGSTFPEVIAVNTGALATFAPAPRSIDVSDYKGKTVRFALRCWNPSANNSNSRTYRIESLRVEDSLPE